MLVYPFIKLFWDNIGISLLHFIPQYYPPTQCRCGLSIGGRGRGERGERESDRGREGDREREGGGETFIKGRFLSIWGGGSCYSAGVGRWERVLIRRVTWQQSYLAVCPCCSNRVILPFTIWSICTTRNTSEYLRILLKYNTSHTTVLTLYKSTYTSHTTVLTLHTQQYLHFTRVLTLHKQQYLHFTHNSTYTSHTTVFTLHTQQYLHFTRVLTLHKQQYLHFTTVLTLHASTYNCRGGGCGFCDGVPGENTRVSEHMISSVE